MGWISGNEKWILAFFSTGVTAFIPYILSNVLEISFTESRVIILKKDTFLQFVVSPVLTNANVGKVDL